VPGLVVTLARVGSMSGGCDDDDDDALAGAPDAVKLFAPLALLFSLLLLLI